MQNHIRNFISKMTKEDLAERLFLQTEYSFPLRTGISILVAFEEFSRNKDFDHLKSVISEALTFSDPRNKLIDDGFGYEEILADLILAFNKSKEALTKEQRTWLLKYSIDLAELALESFEEGYLWAEKLEELKQLE